MAEKIMNATWNNFSSPIDESEVPNKMYIFEEIRRDLPRLKNIMEEDHFTDYSGDNYKFLSKDYYFNVMLTDNVSNNFMKSYITTVFIPLIYIIIFILGLPTNAMAIWVFLFRTKKKNSASIFMASLALSDLLFVFLLPLKIHYHFSGNNWIYGEMMCKLLVGCFYGNMYCSTVFIACISVQRYRAVVHPLSHKLNNRLAVCVSLCVFLVVWLLTIPLYLYEQIIHMPDFNITTCHDVAYSKESHVPAVYFLTMGPVGFVIPSVVCVVAYVLMFQHLRNSVTDRKNSVKKIKAIRLMIVILVLFLVSFAPSNILLMMHYSLQAAGINNELYQYYVVALCLSSLNSCIDPLVYYFISEEFREQVKNVLICRSERTAKRIKVFATKAQSSTDTDTAF